MYYKIIFGAIKQMKICISLPMQPESMRSKIGATLREQRLSHKNRLNYSRCGLTPPPIFKLDWRQLSGLMRVPHSAVN